MHGREVHVDVLATLQQLRQLGEGPVALLLDERANLFQGGLVHLRDRAPAVRAWHRCSLPSAAPSD